MRIDAELLIVSTSYRRDDSGTTTSIELARKEAFNLIKPRRPCRREVQMETWIPSEPLSDRFGIVCGVVVENEIEGFSFLGWIAFVDMLEEFQKLLVPMFFMTLSGHFSCRHFQSRKE